MDTEVVDQSGTATPRTVEPTAGSEVQRQAVESTIDQVDQLLDEVEAALTRLDEGTYGTCGACGRAIDDASLSADPTVRNCAPCVLTEPDPSTGDGVVDEAADGVEGVDGDGNESGSDAFDTDRPPWADRVRVED